MQNEYTVLAQQSIVFPTLSNRSTIPIANDGLLAIGGNLSVATLLAAYSRGIFPWFSEEDPILWWSPSPRCVLIPSQLHTPKSMRKLIHRPPFTITINKAFPSVIRACANQRTQANPHTALTNTTHEYGTWITQEMQYAYIQLHQQGFAHSVEAWHNDTLVGGLYGVSLGRLFFGESMFFNHANASKFAFICFVAWLHTNRCVLIDCQQQTDNLTRFGAVSIERSEFLRVLAGHLHEPALPFPAVGTSLCLLEHD